MKQEDVNEMDSMFIGLRSEWRIASSGFSFDVSDGSYSGCVRARRRREGRQ